MGEALRRLGADLSYISRKCRMPVGEDGCSDFKNPDRPDIPFRRPHFHRDWKASAIREAPCGRMVSLEFWLLRILCVRFVSF